jgi:hypothetical protein
VSRHNYALFMDPCLGRLVCLSAGPAASSRASTPKEDPSSRHAIEVARCALRLGRPDLREYFRAGTDLVAGTFEIAPDRFACASKMAAAPWCASAARRP